MAVKKNEKHKQKTNIKITDKANYIYYEFIYINSLNTPTKRQN